MRKAIFKKVAFLLIIMLLPLTGCSDSFYLEYDVRRYSERTGQAPQETASVEGALEYLKIVYDLDISDLTFLKQHIVAEHSTSLSNWDGMAVGSRLIPENKRTAYLGYSPDDGIYFLIVHDSVVKGYSSSLTGQRRYIERGTRAIAWAEDYFGDRLLGTDVDIYMRPDSGPFFIDEEIIHKKRDPLLHSPHADIREAYNIFFEKLEEPFGYRGISSYMITNDAIPFLNLYVTCSTRELNQERETLLELFRIQNSLIYAADGIMGSNLRSIVPYNNDEEIIDDEEPVYIEDNDNDMINGEETANVE